MTAAKRGRLTLEERAAALGARKRDCRSCKAFRPNRDGLGFGFCKAFGQYVKLYHPPGGFWSQCQFHVLARPAPAGEGE